jgi:hypothetical protein
MMHFLAMTHLDPAQPLNDRRRRWSAARDCLLGVPVAPRQARAEARKSAGPRPRSRSWWIDPVERVVLALTENSLTSPSISGPQSVQLGVDAEFTIRADAAAAVNVVHVDTIDPEGKTVAHYSGNLLVNAGRSPSWFHSPSNDHPGLWMIRANDLLSGKATMAELRVKP